MARFKITHKLGVPLTMACWAVMVYAATVQAQATTTMLGLPASFREAGLTQLSDNFGPVLITDGVVRLPGESEAQRAYLRTMRGDYAAQSLRAEVTVIVQGGAGNGSAFFGMGRGEAEPNYFREPVKEPVIYARFAPSNFAGGELWAWDGVHSKIEVSACNLTTPTMCFYNAKTKRAFLVLAEQGVKVGDGIVDNGFSVEERADRARAGFVISAPGVRERKPEFIGFGASPDRGIDWKRGDEVKIRLRVYSFAALDIPAVLDKLMSARKAVTGANQPRNLMPFSEITRLMTNRIDSRFHKGAEHQFYCPENAAWISFGWIGGLMDTFPMLALGDETHLDRVAKTFDFAMPRAQGKAGYFYGALNHDGKVFGREGYDEFPELALTRKNGDVLYWMLKQLLLLKAQGRGAAIKPQWEQSVKRLADAFVATWQRDGQWGNFVNVDTGAVAVYNTSGGVAAIGDLALASQYFNEPKYRNVAQTAADFYYERDFVKQGMTTGACADILQNADSETAAGFMTSLMALYETTGEARRLEQSRNLANLVATWTVSYDYELPKNTELGALGAKLAGAVWASTQNKHGAPGICTSSGDALFKIYRATSDRRYAELLHDIAHAHAEGIKPDGQITERLTYCDADSRGSRGGGSTGWNELNGILMAMELPGVYARTDTSEIFVFDHVELKSVKRDGNGVTLTLFNPTKFPASVAVLAESAPQTKLPLGATAFLKWPRVEVAAGTSVVIRIGTDGALRAVEIKTP